MANTTTVAAAHPLVSILIPCVGMLEYTKLCIPSVLRHGRPPYELIFLDIGSLDGTGEYLAGLRTGLRGQVRVEVVATPTDTGIGEAVRDAVGRARGEYLVLLNNDTVVTQGWLQGLLGLVNLAPEHGLVGPMSNYAAPPQLIEPVPYAVHRRIPASGELVDVEAIDRFAEEWFAQNRSHWLEAERLGGFCLLVKREVLTRLGTTLEPWADLGLFDTDILGAKARQLGYRLTVCRDLYVHHFGTRAFAHGAPATPEASRR